MHKQTKYEVIETIKNFIDKESEFLPDIYSDMLLDRLAKLLRELENET